MILVPASLFRADKLDANVDFAFALGVSGRHLKVAVNPADAAINLFVIHAVPRTFGYQLPIQRNELEKQFALS